MHAVVLVGGFGTRLRPLTNTVPKPMLPVGNEPLIARLIGGLAQGGVTDVTLALGFRPEPFRAAFPDGRCGDVTLHYAVEPEPLDTGGAIRFAADHTGISDTFVVANGDVLSDLDMAALVATHRRTGATATLHLLAVDDPSAFGVAALDADGRVTGFVEKPAPGEAPSNLINAGTYVFEPAVLDLIPPGRRVSIERDTFPLLVAAGGLYGDAQDGYWLDAGRPDQYRRANLDLLDGRRTRERVVAVAPGALIAADAEVVHSVVGAAATIGRRAQVIDSVILPGAIVGDDAVVADSVVMGTVGDGAVLDDVVVGAEGKAAPGARLAGVKVPDPDATRTEAAPTATEPEPARATAASPTAANGAVVGEQLALLALDDEPSADVPPETEPAALEPVASAAEETVPDLPAPVDPPPAPSTPDDAAPVDDAEPADVPAPDDVTPAPIDESEPDEVAADDQPDRDAAPAVRPILVVGGAGFIGSHLVDRLLVEGAAVDVVDDLSTGSLAALAEARRAAVAADGELRIHTLDATSPEFAELLRLRRPTVVYHLALLPPHTAPAGAHGRCFPAVLDLLEACRAAGVEKVVVALPATAMYGHPSGREMPVKEDPRPGRGVRGVVANAIVELLTEYREQHDVEFTVLALSTTYGPRQRRGVVAAALGAADGGSFAWSGDGRQTRDFLFVDDAVDALARAAERGGGLVINVGTGVQTSLRELWSLVGDGAPPAEPTPDRPDELARFAVSAVRARIHLGWSAWTDLETGLAATREGTDSA